MHILISFYFCIIFYYNFVFLYFFLYSLDTLDSEQYDMLQQFYNDDSFVISNDRIYQSADDEFAGMFGPVQPVAG